MDISAIALAGMQQAQSQFDQAASNLASIGSGSPSGTPIDTVDLSAKAVSLLSAKNVYALNVDVMKIANEMQSHAIDLLA